MIPKTAEEMTNILFASQLHKAYELLTIKARSKRLRESEIAEVEAQVIDVLREQLGFEHEFETFEAELAVADARKKLEQFFLGVRRVRAAQVSR